MIEGEKQMRANIPSARRAGAAFIPRKDGFEEFRTVEES
jgi:hypothetical protein